MCYLVYWLRETDSDRQTYRAGLFASSSIDWFVYFACVNPHLVVGGAFWNFILTILPYERTVKEQKWTLIMTLILIRMRSCTIQYLKLFEPIVDNIS